MPPCTGSPGCSKPARTPGSSLAGWRSSPAKTSAWPTRRRWSSPSRHRQALDFVGLPEAQLNLAQAAVYLATAPKSNGSAMAIWNARADVANGALGEVPAHLRDAHYQGAKVLGHGAGYEYPHDHEGGWVAQTYLPDSLVGRSWYRPTTHGYEQEVTERMRQQAKQNRAGSRVGPMRIGMVRNDRGGVGARHRSRAVRDRVRWAGRDARTGEGHDRAVA